jgi:methyl-accepting chemotaxis protein
MSFIDDIKIGKKLVGGFLVVLLILVVVAGLGYMNLQDSATRQNALYEKMKGTENLALTNAALEKMRGDIYRYIAVPADRPATSASLKAQVDLINTNMKDFRERDLSAEDKATLDKFDAAWAKMQVEYKKLETDTDAGNTKAVDAGLAAGSPAVVARSDCLGAVKTLVTSSFANAESLSTATAQSTASASLIMLIATIVAVIAGLGIALYLSKSITGPIDLVSATLKEMTKGHLSTRLKLSRKDEIGEMAESMDTFSEDLQVHVIGSLDRISKCDLDINLTSKDPKDEITPIIMLSVHSLNEMMRETTMLTNAALDGHLDVRANPEKFQGCYQEILINMNNTLDAVIGPLNVAAEYVDRISKGDMPAKITDKYNGDFNEIKNNLNNCIDNINALVADADMLSKAAVEGKLATRADASRHQGDFRKIVQGVDDTLDAVIGPLNVAADYVDKISKGNMPPKITDKYNGDFNIIKNNLNNCIDNINALVADAEMLRKAAIEGKLATRADASKHQGDYRKIVQGVDDCLDAVIGPLNVAADYVDKISKGAIPQKITDPYNGDFNVIKNNLNNCIDNINALVADANMLAKAAVEGKLDTRADAGKHQGDYRKVVEGVNSTLDSVIGPLNVAAEYVDRISKGDMPAKITDNYNGDFNEIKNNLNNCIDNINALVADANMLAKAADEGKLKTRADASKHQGDYRKIVEGVNQTLDSVLLPVNEALRVSKGYAAQDFTTRVDPNLKVPGDWLAFKEALNNIGVAVSNAITNINHQVTDLAAGAEEANASVEEVSAGAAQVAKNTSAVSVNAEKSMAGIEQVQKAMEDLSRTIQEVATRADVTAKLVQDTTVYSKEGMGLAQKTENGMQGITKSSNEVNTIILEIKGQMDKISEIVNLITDLANQTNLLALNAAIEAARAGDAGRGFAVVATEVKSLAVESRASAEKIAEMINNLQSQTNSAVDAVTAANSGVKQGSEALHETLASFNKIVESIDQISKNVSDVAAASEEQAASVEEVTASVNEVNGLMQSTAKESTDAAAASEESAAAIDQITKVIGNVNTIVDKVTKEVSQFKC